MEEHEKTNKSLSRELEKQRMKKVREKKARRKIWKERRVKILLKLIKALFVEALISYWFLQVIWRQHSSISINFNYRLEIVTHPMSFYPYTCLISDRVFCSRIFHVWGYFNESHPETGGALCPFQAKTLQRCGWHDWWGLIQIICTQWYGFKYSYLMTITILWIQVILLA